MRNLVIQEYIHKNLEPHFSKRITIPPRLEIILSKVSRWCLIKLSSVYESINEILKALKEILKEESRIVALIIVGSCARVECKKKGDLDIDILVNNDVRLRENAVDQLKCKILSILQDRCRDLITNIDIKIKPVSCLNYETLSNYKLGAIIIYCRDLNILRNELMREHLSYSDVESLLDKTTIKSKDPEKRCYKAILRYVTRLLIASNKHSDLFRNYVIGFYLVYFQGLRIMPIQLGQELPVSNNIFTRNLPRLLNELESIIIEFTTLRYNEDTSTKEFERIFNRILGLSSLFSILDLYLKNANINMQLHLNELKSEDKKVYFIS